MVVVVTEVMVITVMVRVIMVVVVVTMNETVPPFGGNILAWAGFCSMNEPLVPLGSKDMVPGMGSAELKIDTTPVKGNVNIRSTRSVWLPFYHT